MNGLKNLDDLLNSGGQRSRSQHAFEVAKASMSMLVKIHLAVLTIIAIITITEWPWCND